ncbi:MAG: hypothetical protein ACJZ14_04065 [Candidatus Neomarinimicrobiota bacterium]
MKNYKLKPLFNYLFGVLIFISSCVAPPEYSDGLMNNLPAIVNEIDYFSLSVFGEDFNDSLIWDLELNLSENDILLSTLIVKDLNVLSSELSTLVMTVTSGDTIFNANIVNDIIFTSEDSISVIGIPSSISLNAQNFTGRLEYQLIKNPVSG